MWIAPNFDGILPELKAIPNWVLAKAVIRNGKTTKPPYQPNGQPASHSNQATWSTFADVKQAYELGGYIGVGFVLDGKPHFGGRYLHGFDWDHCIENGHVDPVVQAELNKLSIARKEVSVSGTGVRGFFLHHEPLASRRTVVAGRSVELYSALRYMTTTGWGKGGTQMSANLSALIELFPEQPSALTRNVETGAATIRGRCPYDAIKATGGFTPDLVSAVETVRADARWGQVYRGDLSDYDGDHSRADLALCGEFARLGLKAGGIDTAFRTSGLYRDKWERDDYRTGTIVKALANAEPKADDRDDRRAKLLDPQNGRVTISMAAPAPRDYLLEGLLVPAKSAVLAGFGGVSKTQLALQLSIAVALGAPFMGKAAKRGNVIVILGEEDRAEIDRRLSAVARYEKLDGARIQTLQTNILGYPLVGCDVRLTAPDKKGLTETTFAKVIIDRASAVGNVRLIVLDHMGLIHGGDFNAREDAALTMRVVNHIAQETGASVMVLAHTPKSANQLEASDASMVAGSTAFVDQARGAWVMATMRDAEGKSFGISAEERKSYVSLTIPKNNYGPTGDVYWFRRVPFDGVGFLELVNLTPQAAAKAVADLGARIIAFVAEHRGQYAKTRLRDTQSGKKRVPLRASKAEVEWMVEILLEEGRLVSRPPTEEEREAFRHGPRVTHVLDVGALGMTPALPTDETKPPEARSPPGGEKPPRRHRRRGK